MKNSINLARSLTVVKFICDDNQVYCIRYPETHGIYDPFAEEIENEKPELLTLTYAQALEYVDFEILKLEYTRNILMDLKIAQDEITSIAALADDKKKDITDILNPKANKKK